MSHMKLRAGFSTVYMTPEEWHKRHKFGVISYNKLAAVTLAAFVGLRPVIPFGFSSVRRTGGL